MAKEDTIEEVIIQNIELYIDDYSMQAVNKTAKALKDAGYLHKSEIRFPEEEKHSPSCLYVKEKCYFGNPSKEKYCTCGAFDINYTISETKKLNGVE